jgi:hypothetical protein
MNFSCGALFLYQTEQNQTYTEKVTPRPTHRVKLSTLNFSNETCWPYILTRLMFLTSRLAYIYFINISYSSEMVHFEFGVYIVGAAILGLARGSSDASPGTQSISGLPDFPCYDIPKRGKIYQITIKYINWPQNIPFGHKIYHLATKYTIWPQNRYTIWPQNIPFGHKIFHMAVK